MDVASLLTESQKDSLLSGKGIPGVTYSGGKAKKVSYDVAKTLGFYQLGSIFRKVNDPVNTYLMVSDANAPTPLYDVDTTSWTDDDWASRSAEVAGSLYLAKDYKLFAPFVDLVATFPNNTKNYTWGGLIRSNASWWSKRSINQVDKACPNSGTAKRMNSVFGLENPYTKNTVVFGYRDDYPDIQKSTVLVVGMPFQVNKKGAVDFRYTWNKTANAKKR